MASTNLTPNYALSQWTATDCPQMEDFNADNLAVDGALKALSDGALRVAVGSYTGTGTAGAGNPNTLSFDFEPKLVLVRLSDSGGRYPFGFAAIRGAAYGMPEGSTSGSGSSDSYPLYFTWSGGALRWYNSYSSVGTAAKYQMNESSRTYYYFAVG